VGTVARERQSAGRAETGEECRRSRSEGAESRPGSLVFVFVFVFFVFLGTSGQYGEAGIFVYAMVGR
jgi:hypothetical protein